MSEVNDTAASLVSAQQPPARPFWSQAHLWILGGALLIGGGLRLWLALSDHGIFWPDEIYQSLEPAHHLTFGYGLLPWEFLQQVRPWAFPGLIAAVLKLCQWTGLDSPAQYLMVVRLLLCLCSLATAWGIYCLARLYAGPVSSACVASVFSLAAPFVYFAHRAQVDPVSALPVVFGARYLLDPKSGPWKRGAGASLFGLAFLLRLQNLLFPAGLLLFFAGRRQWKILWQAGLVFLCWGFFYGLVDRLGWGSWFQSALANFRDGLFIKKTAAFSVEPAWYYLVTYLHSFGPLLLANAALLLAAWRRATAPIFLGLSLVAVYSFIPHKEFRYLFPALPLLLAAAAAGLPEPKSGGERWPKLLVCLYLALVVQSAAALPYLTFGQLGQGKAVAKDRALDLFGPINRLLIVAGRRPDLCGLAIDGFNLHLTGGYSYLHRRVQLYGGLIPAAEKHFYNYRIALGPPPPGAKVAALEAPFTLMRLPWDRCAADPGFQLILP